MKTLLGLVTLAVALTSVHSHHVDLASAQDSANNIIFNGYVAPKGHVPYIVYLSSYNDTHFSHCAGSIINNTWILTAAHCLDNMFYVDIYYGTNTALKSKTTHRVEKENFIIHELYLNGSYFNDIALILTPHVNYTNEIKKVDLPPPFLEKYLLQMRFKACGWGNISRTETPERLRCANLRIIRNEECRQTHNINDDLLCTGIANGKTVCAGDSGGPLVVTFNNPTLIGVAVASTEWCRDLKGPGIFTRVTSYLNWIFEKTGIF